MFRDGQWLEQLALTRAAQRVPSDAYVSSAGGSGSRARIPLSTSSFPWQQRSQKIIRIPRYHLSTARCPTLGLNCTFVPYGRPAVHVPTYVKSRVQNLTRQRQAIAFIQAKACVLMFIEIYVIIMMWKPPWLTLAYCHPKYAQWASVWLQGTERWSKRSSVASHPNPLLCLLYLMLLYTELLVLEEAVHVWIHMKVGIFIFSFMLVARDGYIFCDVSYGCFAGCRRPCCFWFP
jgi:hypothetical protein